MSTSINGLNKRLDKLEGSSCDRDFEQEALDSLSIEDLGTLDEACALYESGYSEVEIANMMGERWPQAEAAIARYQAEMERLMREGTDHPRQLRSFNADQAMRPVIVFYARN
jgi:hypothetical protein